MIMKKLTLVFLFLSLFSLISCETKEPELPLADQVQGNYTFNLVKGDAASLSLPFVNADGETLSARAVVSKVTDTSLKIVFITTRDNGSVRFSEPEILEPFTILKENEAIVGSYLKQKVEFAGTEMSLILTYTDGSVLTYSGPKDL